MYIDGLVQDCSISSVLALEILQSCTKPLKCGEWWEVAELASPAVYDLPEERDV